MKFLLTPDVQGIVDQFTSYLCRLGHKLRKEDWTRASYDHSAHSINPSKYIDLLENRCTFLGCEAVFEITLLNDLERSYALWHYLDNIAVGYAWPGSKIKANANYLGHQIVPQQIICQRLNALK